MCRMFGMVATTPQSIAPWMMDIEPSLRSLAVADRSGEPNSDGWGIGWYDGEQDCPHVVKEPAPANESPLFELTARKVSARIALAHIRRSSGTSRRCLLYTSDAADDLLCVDLGGRCIIKKKIKKTYH